MWRNHPEIVSSINLPKKIITFNAATLKDCYSSESDVIGIYDLFEDSRPVIIIERVPLSKSPDELIADIFKSEGLQALKSLYCISVEKSTYADTVDITLTREDVHSKLLNMV